jgi:N-acetylneuraminic acid mutarotase
MKLLIILLSVFSFTFSLNAQNSWIQKADLGGGNRAWTVGFSIGNFGYIGTGNDSGVLLADIWKWDQISNSWTQVADVGGFPRSNAIGFSINGKGYIGTGASISGPLKDFWEYDPALNQWTPRADFGGTARASAFSFTINGKGYVGTGNDSLGHTNDFWEYDPVNDLWTQKAFFAGNARYGATGIAEGGKGYVVFGSPDFIPVNEFWEYDPILNHWTQKANCPGLARAWASGFAISGRLYVGTGLDVSPPPYHSVDIWEYDISNDQWNQIVDFPDSAVSSAIAFSLNGKGYLGTGLTSLGQEDFFWEYSPLVGIEEYSDTFGNITVSPNPFSHELIIKSSKLFKNATLSIYDITGKEIRSLNNINGQTILVKRGNLQSGKYCCVIIQGTEKYNFNIIASNF